MNDSTPQVLWQGKFLRILKSGRWEYADRVGSNGGVMIVAVTDERKLVLLEQFRVPLGRNVIELPAGLAGDIPDLETEALATAASRELLEETGYETAEMICLTSGPPSAGLASEIVTFFRAERLRKVHHGGGDGHEQIVVHEVPLDRVADWLAAKAAEGLLVDPKVYAGLFFAMQR